MQRMPFTARVRRARMRTLVAVGVGAAIAFVAANVLVSLGGAASVRPPQPATLPELVLREVGATGPAGISAHFRYVNGLVPNTSSLPAVTGGGPTPLLEGAQGRLWWGSGRLRMEFQTDAGDTQVLVHGSHALMYDAAAGNAFGLDLPSLGSSGTIRSGLAGAAQLLLGLRSLMHVTRPVPGVTAGRPSYTVTLRPVDGQSLIGAVTLEFDAVTGTPLRVDVYARRSPQPVVELALSQISYDAVSNDVFDVRLPFGMHPSPIRFSSPPSLGGTASCAAPASIGSLRLTSCRVAADSPGLPGRLLVYGNGLGAVLVLEQPSDGDPTGGLWDLLPAVTVGRVSGREIATTLGSVIRFGRGGVTYTVAGSRPRDVIRAVARGL
jgi:hypothetical protein